MINTITRHRTILVMASLLSILLLVLSACATSNGPASQAPASSPDVKASELKGNITVSGAWALYPMMVRWAEEFQKLNPGVRIEVSAGGAGKGAADALGGLVDIGMVSRDVFPAEIERGAFYVGSVIDAVVPTANPGNPVKDDILAKGITKQSFVDIWITGKITDWRDVFPGTKAFGKTELHVLTRSDAAGAPETWAKYLGGKQEDLLGIGVYGDPGLAETVRRDPLAIGFNNIGYAYDAKTRKPVEGLLVIPIDVNGNGKIDPEENVYGTLDELTQAIAKHAYPWPPARELNLVTRREFKGVTREFVKWILTDGQRYAPEAGYIPLSEERVQQELAKIR
ncbi:MAG: substrate-binding domain-containing protein [Chloroflexota bacterium]